MPDLIMHRNRSVFHSRRTATTVNIYSLTFLLLRKL